MGGLDAGLTVFACPLNVAVSYDVLRCTNRKNMVHLCGISYSLTNFVEAMPEAGLRVFGVNSTFHTTHVVIVFNVESPRSCKTAGVVSLFFTVAH